MTFELAFNQAAKLQAQISSETTQTYRNPSEISSQSAAKSPINGPLIHRQRTAGLFDEPKKLTLQRVKQAK